MDACQLSHYGIHTLQIGLYIWSVGVSLTQEKLCMGPGTPESGLLSSHSWSASLAPLGSWWRRLNKNKDRVSQLASFGLVGKAWVAGLVQTRLVNA